MLAMHIAPGLRRTFGCEGWQQLEGVSLAQLFAQERAQAVANVRKDVSFTAQGYDIDPYAVQLAKDNVYRAGVAACVRVEQRDIADFSTNLPKATIICNPPYGERLLEIQQAEKLYQVMGQVFEQRRFLNYYIISPHESFEQLFGLGADKRRKLYNGMIRCHLFMYYKGGVPLSTNKKTDSHRTPSDFAAGERRHSSEGRTHSGDHMGKGRGVVGSARDARPSKKGPQH